MKKIIALIFVCLFFFSVLSGCDIEEYVDTAPVDIEVVQYGGNYTIYCDVETRVMYVKIDSYSGISPLYNADGTLRLYQGD